MRRSSKAIALAALLLTAAASLSARPQLLDLDIRVVLGQNGDARITETRRMYVDSEGTECYIVLGNLNGSSVHDLQVSDETGRSYENIGKWDIDRSRSQKANRCGIVRSRGGYELCWGLGESGSRIYTTSYTVTKLLRGYQDADGFLYMFVAEGLSPSPDHVKVTIGPEQDTLRLTEENTRVWGFRYRGDVRIANGGIVAESSEPFSGRSALIVMAQFEQGLFAPAVTTSQSFEQVKERAFEGSDYDDGAMTASDILALVLLFLVPVLAFLGYIYYVWRERRKVTKDLLWWRDIPWQGNLQRANDVLNAYKYFSTDYNNLLSACILKLIDMGAISIEQRQNAKGKMEQNFVIQALPDAERQPRLLQMVHQIFKDAAGSDTVLEPWELKSWMRSSYNQSVTDSFIQTLHTKTSIYQYKNDLEEVRHLFGLKKFLKEFSLLDERHVQEVALWKDYMIYATLFGIAEQVIKDMKKINPEYFNMDKVAQQMADDMTLPMIYSTMHSSTSRAAMSKAEREARASGRGGRSSWGGGGGFSGGGFGGGVR